MVDALGDGERCVCELVEVAGLAWSTVSRHLTILKDAGVLEDEKRGQQVFYRLRLACVADLNRCLDGSTAKGKKVAQACCASKVGRS
jgi:DNA-binding transcriptional ArsR family regulator